LKHKLSKFIMYAFGKRHRLEHTKAQHSIYCYMNLAEG